MISEHFKSGININISFDPEAEFKFVVPDRKTALEVVKYLGMRDLWHKQTTPYFDYTKKPGNRKPSLGFAAEGSCLRNRKITSFADISFYNKNLDHNHMLTLKVERGVVRAGASGGSFLSRMELSVQGLDSHDPSPDILKLLFSEYQKDLLKRRGKGSDPSPLDNRISRAIHGMGAPASLRMFAVSSGIRHDGHRQLKKSSVACCVDILKMRTVDQREQDLLELEFELIPSAGQRRLKSDGHDHKDIADTNSDFVEFACKIQNEFGLKVQHASKAAQNAAFTMEGEHIFGEDSSRNNIGILWPEAAERQGLKLSRRDRDAYKFMMHGNH